MDSLPSTTPAVLGSRLREARDAKGMTLDDVIWAQRERNIPSSMTMSRGKVGQLEKGHVASPDPWDLLLLATIYGVPLAEISPEASEDIARFRQIVTTREASTETPCSPDLEPLVA